MKHITPTLPSHIDPLALHKLIDTIATEILHNYSVHFALDACDLQPTSRAASLAATAAVSAPAILAIAGKYRQK